MAFTRSSLTSTLLKFYVVSVLLSSWLVSAQIQYLPTCAQPCVDTAVKAAGCDASDAKCLCSKNSFQSAVANCANHSCTIEDQSSTYGALQSFCAQASSSSSSSGSSSSSTTTSKPGTSTTPTGTTKPATPSSQPSNTAATSKPNTPATTPPPVATTITVGDTGPSSSPAPLTILSLPSSAVSTGDGTSVVLQTVTSTPTGNAALGMHAVMDGTFAAMLGLGLVGAILGSLVVL